MDIQTNKWYVKFGMQIVGMILGNVQILMNKITNCKFDVLKECTRVNRSGKPQECVYTGHALTKAELMLHAVLEGAYPARVGLKNKWKYEKNIKLYDKMTHEEKEKVNECDMWKHYVPWKRPTVVNVSRGDLRSQDKPNMSVYVDWMQQQRAKQLKMKQPNTRGKTKAKQHRAGLNNTIYGFNNAQVQLKHRQKSKRK